NPRVAVEPGCCPARAVPGKTADDVVAIAQGDDARRGTDLIPRRAADEAVGLRENAVDATVAVAPGQRSTLLVPARRNHDIVAVTQRGQGAPSTDAVPRGAAHEAIGLGDNPADPRTAVDPGDGPASAIPARTTDDEVAVAQGSEAEV